MWAEAMDAANDDQEPYFSVHSRAGFSRIL